MNTSHTIDSTAAQAVHVAIIRKVREGFEAEFERQAAAFFEEAASQPGVCGAYLIRPVAGSNHREYGILRSFHNEADMRRFYESDLYTHWQHAVQPLVHGEPQKRRLHGLEAFFHLPGASPPKWKMAMLTWLSVNVAVFGFSALVPVLFGDLPALVGLLLVNALVVASLTWILMPVLIRAVDRWLSPQGLDRFSVSTTR